MSAGLIFKKMSDVMKEIKSVTKAQTNTAQGFKFRGIDQFVNALYPALTKHGVFMTPRSTSYTQELKDVVRGSGKPGVDKHVSILMEYDFYAEDGSKVTVGPIPAEGLDSGDKATNKALSAALKYALIQTFSVPTEDMAEADLDSPEIGTKAVKNIQPTKAEMLTGVQSTVRGNSEATLAASKSDVDVKSSPAVEAVKIVTEATTKRASFARAKKEPNAPVAAVSNGEAAPSPAPAKVVTGWEN